MAALYFVNVMQELINAVEKNSILRSTKDVAKFSMTLFNRNMQSLSWFNLMNLLNSSGNQLQGIKTIVTDWFQQQNKFTTEFKSTWAVILTLLTSGFVNIGE